MRSCDGVSWLQRATSQKGWVPMNCSTFYLYFQVCVCFNIRCFSTMFTSPASSTWGGLPPGGLPSWWSTRGASCHGPSHSPQRVHAQSREPDHHPPGQPGPQYSTWLEPYRGSQRNLGVHQWTLSRAGSSKDWLIRTRDMEEDVILVHKGPNAVMITLMLSCKTLWECWIPRNVDVFSIHESIFWVICDCFDVSVTESKSEGLLSDLRPETN